MSSTLQVSVPVSNSVTNGLNDLKQDREKPFSFTQWMDRVRLNDITKQGVFVFYTAYLSSWSVSAGVNQSKQIAKQKYFELLKEISLNYTNEEEQRYLSNIDLSNRRDLLIAIPFFAKKLKQLCIYYTDQREKIKSTVKKNNLTGSMLGMEHYVRDVLHQFALDNRKSNRDVVLSSKLDSRIENLYVLETEKLNSDAQEFYNAYPEGCFPEEFLDATEFAKFEADMKGDLGTFNKLHAGVDYKYLKVTSKLYRRFEIGDVFKAADDATNISNSSFPSMLNVDDADLYTEKEIGKYFTPKYMGVLYFNSFDLSYNVDFDAADESLVYIFPDPTKIQTREYKKQDLPLVWMESDKFFKVSRANSFKFGAVLDNAFYQYFYSYQSRQSSLNIGSGGISDVAIDYDFWEGDLNDVFSGVSKHGFNDIATEQAKILSTETTMDSYQEDVFGNFYAVYKNLGDVRASDSVNAQTYHTLYNDGTDKNILLSTGTFIPRDENELEYTVALSTGYYYIFGADLSVKNFGLFAENLAPLPSASNKTRPGAVNSPVSYDLYKNKYRTYSNNEIYFRNNSSEHVGNLFDLHPFLISRYSTVSGDILTSTIGLDVYGDILVLFGEDFLVIDRLLYDINTGLLQEPPVIPMIRKVPGNITPPWYDQKNGKLYFSNVSLIEDALSTTSLKTPYATLSSFDLQTFSVYDEYSMDNSSYAESFSLSTAVLSSTDPKYAYPYDILKLHHPIISKNDEYISVAYVAEDRTGYRVLNEARFNVAASKIVYDNVYQYTVAIPGEKFVNPNTPDTFLTFVIDTSNDLQPFDYDEEVPMSVDGDVLSGYTAVSSTVNNFIFN